MKRVQTNPSCFVTRKQGSGFSGGINTNLHKVKKCDRQIIIHVTDILGEAIQDTSCRETKKQQQIQETESILLLQSSAAPRQLYKELS